MKTKFSTAFLLSFILLFLCSVSAQETVSICDFLNLNNVDHIYTKHLLKFMKKNPDIRLKQWSGISLPGSGKSSLMMALAGGTAPDIGCSWYHIIRNEIKQEFLYPLNEWIGDDLNGDGKVDGDEVKWKPWLSYPPLVREVCTVNGKIYGLPQALRSIQVIVFRTDLVEMAGLDPRKPPKTWDEFVYWCRKLTDPNKHIPGAITQNGQKAFLIPVAGHQFLPWIQSAGGDPIIQIRKSPKTGKEYTFPQDETDFITPEGENLSKVPSDWRCNFAAQETKTALHFFHKLRWEKWVNINGKVMSVREAMKKKLEFSPDDIVTGVGRVSGRRSGEGTYELLSRGEIAMLTGSAESLKEIGSNANLDPSLLSWFPVPAGPGSKGRRIIQTHTHYAVMYNGVAKRPKKERDAVWRVLQAIADPKLVKDDVDSKVLEGLGRFVSPNRLRECGYEEYLKDMPVAIKRAFQDLEDGKIKTFSEPWNGHWFMVEIAMNRECLGILTGSLGQDFDAVAAMEEINRKANSGLMFNLPEKTLQRWRPLAYATVIVVLLLVVFLAVSIIKSYIKKRTGGSRGVYKGYLPFLLILPALLIIGLWKYYPLARGLVMAFQDYHVTGTSQFIGMDNFITLVLDNSFWRAMGRTVYFVGLNMLLAFTAPIILAILLTEIRHLKIFYRTLFFLPQMTSGIVIALMWTLMYNPTPAGFFNQLIAYLNYLPFVNIEPQAWLEDPQLAMICCIIPTVWSSMGMSSLLYLAALHSIPPDLYEAAEVDGAGFRSKLWNITLPTLLPLIIISFVGTFISTFQNMGNIFLMTFGGPGEATTVIGLKIWMEAYMNLRFGMATSMACLLGTLLIGLTYIQIRFLGKVEYKRAAD